MSVKPAEDQRALPLPGCGFSRVAVLTAYRLEEGVVRADLLLLGVDAASGRAGLRRIANQSLGSSNCSKLERAVKESGAKCHYFARSGMMTVPFDAGAAAGLSALILNRDRLTGSIVVNDLLGGEWTPLPLQSPPPAAN